MFGSTPSIVFKILSDAKDGLRGLDQAESKVGRLGKVAGGAALAGLGAAAGAAGALGVVGGKMASDLEQSVGAVDTVFKGNADVIHGWAKGAEQDVGLTRDQYNGLGTLIATQLKNGGTAMDELAPKTDELIGLGADLSSMFGGDTSQAVAALSSALKGERDPIEAYGVSLTQAAVDAKAAELGFEKVGSTLSAEANQAATLALIMDQTSDAHGNFAREADTVAGVQQRVVASAKNLVTEMGAYLLPILLTLFTFLNTTAIPALGGLVDAFAAAGAEGGLAERLGLTALQPILAGMIPALQAFGTSVVTFVTGTLVPAGQQIAANLFPVLQAIWSTVIPAVIGAFQTIAPAVVPVVTAIVGLAVAISGRLAPVFLALMPVVTTVFSVVSSVVSSALAVISSIISTVTAVISGDWSAAWDGVQNTVDAAWQLIGTIIDGAMVLVESVITSGLDAVLALFDTSWDEIGSATSDGIDRVLQFCADLPGNILSALGNLGGLLTSAGSDLIAGFMQGIGNMAKQAADKAREVAAGAVAGVKSFLGIASPSKVFRQLGEFTGQGLVIGLDRQRRDVERAATGLLGAPDKLASRMSPVEVAFGARNTRQDRAAATRPQVVIKVDGALDPVAVARQIKSLLSDYDALVTAR